MLQSLNAFEGGWLAGGESHAGAPASPIAEFGPPTSSPGAGPKELGPDQGLFSANQVWKGRMMLLPAVRVGALGTHVGQVHLAERVAPVQVMQVVLRRPRGRSVFARFTPSFTANIARYRNWSVFVELDHTLRFVSQLSG